MKSSLLTTLGSLSLFVFLAVAGLSETRAAQIDLTGPVGSGAFGTGVTMLPNGNFVVTDPGYDAPGPISNVGAVYLYDGVTLAVVSTLIGNTANDSVGSGGVTVLSNGNFVVRSGNWNGSRGAVTWVSGTTGLTGVVSSVNSLVGVSSFGQVGGGGITALNNGNFVVSSPSWSDNTLVSAGAVTWGSGTTGLTGVVSSVNSLVGISSNNQVGNGGVTALNNGNFVVSSPNWSASSGAVTWGNGTTGATGVVSSANSLVGSGGNDQVGAVTALNNGNYVVRSPGWYNGTARVGAVTWCNGTTGVTGEVSSANSLVGSTANDGVGNIAITTLTNGNYVVRTPVWDNGTTTDAGAVTWGSGMIGVKGEISSANSLVGTTANDQVGFTGITALTNGNYVVRSAAWNGSRGAVTFGNGTLGVNGVVSSANSLVGTTANDQVGVSGVTTLNNGNYVVRSPFWNGSRGAATWGSGAVGVSGTVSSANSLVGSTANDQVGSVVTALAKGNYVVSSTWNNGATIYVGASTWGNGSGGTIGPVSAANSLVGSATGDAIGSDGVAVLSNGNYVVRSSYWHNGGVVDAGAATWGNGLGGTVGPISSANSLVGSATSDRVGPGVIALKNGNYVVFSSLWNGARGAVTWGSGITGVNGVVSAANSLVGNKANDGVGGSGVTALTNGNYVVISPGWDDGSLTDAGAVTWGNGLGGTVGLVTSVNSLVGSTVGDVIGSSGVIALNNGNYLVRSVGWDNGTATDAGAVTWGNGLGGTVGSVTPGNSLVGSTTGDGVGSSSVTALTNGNYVVSSATWDNIAAIDAGAITLGDGTRGISGFVAGNNSVLGTVASGGSSMNFAYDYPKARLLVGSPGANRVSLFSPSPEISVEQPANVNLLDGGSKSFGGVIPGANTNLTFTIKNIGNTDLTGLGLTIDGSDASLFTVTTSPTAPVSGPSGSTTFTVRFAPVTTGLKTAALHLTSNDADENPFDLTLTGAGLTTIQAWRQIYFGSQANSGDGADLNDYEHDGIVNYVEYAFGLNPKQDSLGQLPKGQIIGGNLVTSFAQPADVTGFTYGAEWSLTLLPGSWTEVSDTGTPPQHIFSVPIATSTNIFMRLKVTSP